MRLDSLICWRFDPFASLHRGIGVLARQLPPRTHHPLWELLAQASSEKIEAYLTVCEGADRARWSLEVAASWWNDKVSSSETLSFEAISREIELRSRPLRERWLGFAPGACRYLERALGESPGKAAAPSGSEQELRLDFVPVLPHQGGGGTPRWVERARLEYEAVLYDVDSRCPEWLRWLRGALALQLAARHLELSEAELSQTRDASWREAWEAVGPVTDVLTVAAAAWVEALAWDESTVVGLARSTRQHAWGTDPVERESVREAEVLRLFKELDETALHRPESLAGWINQQLQQTKP